MIHGIIFSIVIVALLVYAGLLTRWVVRVKNTCTCGVAHGKFLPIIDKPVEVIQQLESPRYARRWTTEDFGRLLPTRIEGNK